MNVLKKTTSEDGEKFRLEFIEVQDQEFQCLQKLIAYL